MVFLIIVIFDLNAYLDNISFVEITETMNIVDLKKKSFQYYFIPNIVSLWKNN